MKRGYSSCVPFEFIGYAAQPREPLARIARLFFSGMAPQRDPRDTRTCLFGTAMSLFQALYIFSFLSLYSIISLIKMSNLHSMQKVSAHNVTILSYSRTERY